MIKVFQAFGKNIEECFSNASYALVEIITKDKIKDVERRYLETVKKEFLEKHIHDLYSKYEIEIK